MTDMFLQNHELEVMPSHEMVQTLRQLPAKSVVGIESLTEPNWNEVKADLEGAMQANGLRGGYRSTNHFWYRLADIVMSEGHEVSWLEDKALWFKYHHATVQLSLRGVKPSNLRQEDGESDEEHHRRFVGWREEVYRAKIAADKIHLLERDNAILRNIADSGAEVVIAGLGHTDMWMLNVERIRKKFGFTFGEYSTDTVRDSDFRFSSHGLVSSYFTRNAVPDPCLAFDFDSVERALMISTDGSFSSETADWVGTWSVQEPSRGYFELYIENRDGDYVSGRIEDCLGTARFEGEITSDSARFLKTYQDSRRDALPELTFEAEGGNKKHGAYRSPGGAGNFYMERPNGSSPLDMSMSWFKLTNQSD